MTKRVLACVALAVGCLAQVCLALPDLVVARLEISPTAPTASALVTLTATIENTGRGDADRTFFVRFSVDNHEIHIVPIASLRSGRTEVISES